MAQKSKSALFLIEMIISILFFIISTAICMQVFVTAHLISKKSVDLSTSIFQAQTVASLYSAGKGDIAFLVDKLQYNENADGTYTSYFDANGVFTNKENSLYQLDIEETDNSNLNTISIEIHSNDNVNADPIYILQSSYYLQNTKEVIDNE